MKKITVGVLVFCSLMVSSRVFAGDSDAYFIYQSPYDPLFVNLDASSSNMLIESLYSEDLNLVYSALKKIGDIKLKAAKVNVKDVLGFTNPAANYGKPMEMAKRKNIYLMSIWVLGRIGDDTDAELLASYIKDSTDIETQYYIILALGEFAPSAKALEALNKMTGYVTDERLAKASINAILKHNSKSSIIPLLKMSERPIFSPEFKKIIANTIDQLGKTGK